MEKNTQYLYEYENGKRIRNIGFMKIDEAAETCSIVIHARMMDEVVGIQFRKENGERYLAGWGEELEEVVQVQEIDEPEDYFVPGDTVYEKISRQELSRLPRKEWRIANNSFLLHGFHNYHHLLYMEENGMIWIGVPGIFHEKEKQAAEAFGFPTFRRVTDVNLDLQEEEMNPFEDFGYWCRMIREG